MALGVRNKSGGKHHLPMVPVFSENVSEKHQRTRGFEAHYAACPGREFLIKVKEIFPSDAAEFGFRVFLDQGPNPKPDTLDHFMWFGHYKRDSDYESILKVEGSYRSVHESYALSFATAVGQTAVGQAAATPRKRKRKTQEQAVDVDETDSENPADKVGWAVLRFHKVKMDQAGASIYRSSHRNVQQPRCAGAQQLLHGQDAKGVHQLAEGAVLVVPQLTTWPPRAEASGYSLRYALKTSS